MDYFSELRWIGVRFRNTNLLVLYFFVYGRDSQKSMPRRLQRHFFWWLTFPIKSMTGFQTLFQRQDITVVKLGDEIWIILLNSDNMSF